jgi:hypothetical protein
MEGEFDRSLQWICASLSNSSRDSSGKEFSQRSWIYFSIGNKPSSNGFVRHKIETDLADGKQELSIIQIQKMTNVRRDPSNCWDNASVQCEEPAFRFVHDDHGFPHSGRLHFVCFRKLGE